jgi:hypothetical protein
VLYRLLEAHEKEIGELVWHGGGVVLLQGALLTGAMQGHRRLGGAPYPQLQEVKAADQLMTRNRQVEHEDVREGALQGIREGQLA